MRKIKSFLSFLVVWIIALALIELTSNIWWVEMLGDVCGGVMFLLWGRFDQN